jgi:DNA-binding transcriptional MocR family regulator
VSRPDGGFVLWLQLPKPLASRELFEAALKKGVCFVPGDVFSASHRYANCLRVSCGSAWQTRIEKALETLGDIASAALVRHGRVRSSAPNGAPVAQKPHRFVATGVTP